MSIALKLTMGLCVAGAIASFAVSAPLVWTGAAGDNNWITGGNWDTGTAPGQTAGAPDTVTFGIQGINSASHTIGGSVFYLNAITVGVPGSPPDFGATKYLANASSGGKIVLQADGTTMPTITAYMCPGDSPAATRNLVIAAPIELQADTHIKRVGTVLPYTRTFHLTGPITGTGNLTIESGSASYAAAIHLTNNNSFTGNVTVTGGSNITIEHASAFGNPANQVTFAAGGTSVFTFGALPDGSVIPNDIVLAPNAAVNPYWTWNDGTPSNRDVTLAGNITGGTAGSGLMQIFARDYRRLFLTGMNPFFGDVRVMAGSELIIGGANASDVALENTGKIILNEAAAASLAPEATTAFLLQGSYVFNGGLEIANVLPSAVIQPVATIGQMNSGATAYDATFTGKIDVREQDYQVLNLYAEAGGSARFTNNIFNNVTTGQGFSVNHSFEEIEGVAPGTRRYGSPTGTVILDTTSRVARTDGGTGAIGPVNVARGSLQVDTDHFYASTVAIAPEATLTGTGRVSAEVTLGGTHAPGNSVGSQTVGSAVWLPGGKFELEINDADGTAGGPIGWDLLVVGDGAGAGTLDLTGLSPANPFEIHVVSLDGESAGNAANFIATQPYDWLFVSYDELADDYFDPNAFIVNIDGFSNATGKGYFAVTQVTGGLAVSFIPEPGTLAMALTALALLVCRRRRT